jgi:hypothetical protein
MIAGDFRAQFDTTTPPSDHIPLGGVVRFRDSEVQNETALSRAVFSDTGEPPAGQATPLPIFPAIAWVSIWPFSK